MDENSRTYVSSVVRGRKITRDILEEKKSGGRNSSKQAGKQEIFFCYFFKLAGKIGKSIKFLFSFLSSLGKYIRLINLNEKQRESIRERHYDY